MRAKWVILGVVVLMGAAVFAVRTTEIGAEKWHHLWMTDAELSAERAAAAGRLEIAVALAASPLSSVYSISAGGWANRVLVVTERYGKASATDPRLPSTIANRLKEAGFIRVQVVGTDGVSIERSMEDVATAAFVDERLEESNKWAAKVGDGGGLFPCPVTGPVKDEPQTLGFACASQASAKALLHVVADPAVAAHFMSLLYFHGQASLPQGAPLRFSLIDSGSFTPSKEARLRFPLEIEAFGGLEHVASEGADVDTLLINLDGAGSHGDLPDALDEFLSDNHVQEYGFRHVTIRKAGKVLSRDL